MRIRGCLWIAGLLALTLSGSGCMSMSVGIEPSNTPITEEDSYTILGPTSGSSWGVLLYIIPIYENNPCQKAMDRAIRNGGGNALIEVASTVTQYFFFIINVTRTNVKGTAIKLVKGGAKSGAMLNEKNLPAAVVVNRPPKGR